MEVNHGTTLSVSVQLQAMRRSKMYWREENQGKNAVAGQDYQILNQEIVFQVKIMKYERKEI